MKRLTAAQKARHVRLARKRWRNRRRRTYLRTLTREDRRKSVIGLRTRVTVTCPEELDILSPDAGVRKRTLRFYHKLHNAWRADRNELLYVDLTNCLDVSIASALVLIAELDILSRRHPGLIKGCDPVAEEARAVLAGVRFHEYLDLSNSPLRPLAAKNDNVTVIIRRGTLADGGDPLPEAAASVSSILRRDHGDSEYARETERRIHRPLNEGMLNVIQHAYRSRNPGAAISALPPEEHCWWVLGIVLKEQSNLSVLVYDRGVGIPNTLKPTARERAEQLMANRTRDEARLLSSMQYGRTSRKGPGGSGMSEMLSLIDDFPHSQIIVESGHARYIRSNRGNDEMKEVVLPQAVPTNGTLIYWMLQLDGKDLIDHG